MKARTLFPVMFVVLLSVFIVVSVAQASVEPVLAVDELFTAVTACEIEQATSLFAADAVARNDVANIMYEGAAEISGLLDGWERDGRLFDIVKLEMLDDTVDLTVEISDDGIVWARQSMTAAVNDGKIQNLDVHQIELQLWRVWD
jgi:hypothetical protein